MTDESAQDFAAVAEAAKAAAAELATVHREHKDHALDSIAAALADNTDRILTANATDLERGETAGISASLLDRLTLTPQRISDIAQAVLMVAGLPDPVGDVVRGFTLANGLQVRQVRVPFGVIGMIYEARPNVTVDAAALCIKSGNAALLRGSSSAAASNRELVDVMREALAATSLPVDCVSLVPGDSHASVTQLMQARQFVDVIIPRGGAELINNVVENSTVPVIETGVGNCHLFVDASADLAMALQILLNAKTHRPSVCNALETLLIDASVASEFLAIALPALEQAGVTVHGDAQVGAIAGGMGFDIVPATDDDWSGEYLSLDLAVGIVADVGTAISHIRRWSSGHTDAIVADSERAIQRFIGEVDSAAVIVNASTRFTDGGEFGFGAEIGISTQKLHARGPMGLAEMTSTKYVVTGDGQVRS